MHFYRKLVRPITFCPVRSNFSRCAKIRSDLPGFKFVSPYVSCIVAEIFQRQIYEVKMLSPSTINDNYSPKTSRAFPEKLF